MFKKSHPLQSKSEIILRNIVVIAMIAFFSIFLIVPIGIAFAGSFHEWNPLSGTYNFLGLENYKEVFTSSLFGKSMLNTLIFSGYYFPCGTGIGNCLCDLFSVGKTQKLFPSNLLYAGCYADGGGGVCMEVHV